MAVAMQELQLVALDGDRAVSARDRPTGLAFFMAF